MRGILIDPGEAPEIPRFPNTEQELAELAGGLLQRRPIRHRFAALLFVPLRGHALPTRFYDGSWYYGRLLIVGWRNNRMTDLSRNDAEDLARRWNRMEVEP